MESKSKKSAIIRTILMFVIVFVIVILLINLPAFISKIKYSANHSPDVDNETLTEQYRNLYGYQNHPEWSYLHPAPTKTPAPSIPRTNLPVQTAISYATNLEIPKLNLSAPILNVPAGDDNAILKALEKGVVQFPGSPNPDQGGMTVIIGHSSSNLPWNNYSNVFSNLDNLQTNDLIYLNYNNQKYTYRVVAKRKGSPQEILDSGISGDLLLSTCWPIGTDKNRIAVAAVLLK